jgi:2-polyprenyl-6-methoxyphenol hydroxylase-like FAD-dependent oxidoreductase
MINVQQTQCCIAGGGPAGMMLGFLLARMGVEVVVLEKHADFLRDFRGDTIHPATLELMHELGLLEALLRRPHDEARTLAGLVGPDAVTIADFSHLPTRCRFIAFMPQWEFLDFLAAQARRYKAFRLRMQCEATGLIEEDGRVVGVRAEGKEGPAEIRAALVIAADGRHSVLRERAGLVVENKGAPMDVLWMRLSRRGTDPDQTLGRIDRGRMLVMIDRRDYWQCGFVIRRGGYGEIHARGLPALRSEIAGLAPFVADRVAELATWDDVKLLTVAVDRLRRWWRPGLLCIGDAAHAMSPIAGVGINLAIQDAVAAANRLGAPLRDGRLAATDLAAVQRRREFPTVMTQQLQILIQNRVIGRVLANAGPTSLAFPFTLLNRFPALRRIPARFIGMGFRPEHIGTPDVLAGAHTPGDAAPA